MLREDRSRSLGRFIILILASRSEGNRKELPILITNCPYISATKMQNDTKIQLKIQFFPLSLPLLTSFPCNGVSVKSAFDTAIYQAGKRASREREGERKRKKADKSRGSSCSARFSLYIPFRGLRPGHCATQ